MLDWILFFGVGVIILITWIAGVSTEQIKRKRNAIIKDEYDRRFKNKR